MAQVQVITGPTRYRSWSEDQKRALVLAAFAPGATVTDVARQADVSASILYRSRRPTVMRMAATMPSQSQCRFA